MSQGVCMVAYGEPARQEAAASIESLRRFHDWPVTVIGEPVDGATHHLPYPDTDQGGRWAKVNLDKLSPYAETLYLDADTRVRQPIGAGFEILSDGWDMVCTTSQNQSGDWLWHIDEEDRDATLQEAGHMLQLGGGVFWFKRNARTTRLFEAWRAEWTRWRNQDQGALIRALYREPVRVWLLPRLWNGGAIVEHRFGKARRGTV